MKGIEGVEEFLLCAFLANDKLDIVDEEHIVVSVFLTELRGGDIVFVTDCVDQFVRELLGGHIEDLCLRVIL